MFWRTLLLDNGLLMFSISAIPDVGGELRISDTRFPST